MKISVKGFDNGGEIPKEFTCDGTDFSPGISWEELPEGTKALALIMDDPDAPGGTFTHWLIYNIPPSEIGLHEKYPRENSGRDISQGRSDFEKTGYGGPCPPRGKPHRYFFRLYALSSDEKIEAGIIRKKVDASLKGKVIGEAEYMGTYKRE